MDKPDSIDRAMEFEAILRVEFERQHRSRNLTRHHLRGTYSAPPIAALWNQHVRTALWMAARAAGVKAQQ